MRETCATRCEAQEHWTAIIETSPDGHPLDVDHIFLVQIQALIFLSSASRDVWKTFWATQQRFFKLLCVSMKVSGLLRLQVTRSRHCARLSRTALLGRTDGRAAQCWSPAQRRGVCVAADSAGGEGGEGGAGGGPMRRHRPAGHRRGRCAGEHHCSSQPFSGIRLLVSPPVTSTAAAHNEAPNRRAHHDCVDTHTHTLGRGVNS